MIRTTDAAALGRETNVRQPLGLKIRAETPTQTAYLRPGRVPLFSALALCCNPHQKSRNSNNLLPVPPLSHPGTPEILTQLVCDGSQTFAFLKSTAPHLTAKELSTVCQGQGLLLVRRVCRLKLGVFFLQVTPSPRMCHYD